jgi:hypothetical protein
MATSLNSIFGNDIVVADGPLEVSRLFNSFAGANGLTTIYMGSRGSPLLIIGSIRGTGIGYNASRADAAGQIATIESWLSADAGDYTYRGQNFYNVVWEKLELIPDIDRITYSRAANGDVCVRFIMYGRELF